MDKAKEDNEQCKDALETVIDNKDMYDCDEIKEVCKWVIPINRSLVTWQHPISYPPACILQEDNVFSRVC